MNNEKVKELVSKIEAAFMELAEVTGDNHVSAFVVNGAFFLATYNGDNKNIDVYRRLKNNE